MTKSYSVNNGTSLPEKKMPPSDEYRNEDVELQSVEEDPWALPEFKGTIVPWSELTPCQKVVRVLWHYIGKTILLLGFLYIFICSLSFLGDAFKLLGGKAVGEAMSEIELLSNPVAGLMIGVLGTVLSVSKPGVVWKSFKIFTICLILGKAAGEALSESDLLKNPVAGLMIGVLGTVLLQSSSTTTSIVVSMVGSKLLEVRLAIPIVMGANIGTSVTNTIVSIGQITDKADFRRAFAGATVHDVFNWLTVLILLPIEVLTHYLERLSGAIIDSLHLTKNEEADKDYLKVITNPLTKLVIQVDKKIITKIAQNKLNDTSVSIIKHKCKDDAGNEIKCKFLFEQVSNPEGGAWSDTVIGILLLLIALFLLCLCLICIVKLLHSLLQGQIAKWIRSFVNANFPGYCGYFTGYLAILIGAGITVLVQSSSIFTSSITPLVGMGVISLDRMYPLTLGSNIGTTATGILAAFAQDESDIPNSLQIALCHLFFNITGIVIFYPLPFFRPPINAAKFLGTRTEKYRWFAIVYLILCFFAFPAIVFGLSYWSWIALAVVMIPIGVIAIIIAIIKFIQAKRPSILPRKLRDWKWLPVWMRSLEPMDRALMCLTGNCFLCRKCGCCKTIRTADEENRADRVEKIDVKHLDGMTNDGYTQSSENVNGVNGKTAL